MLVDWLYRLFANALADMFKEQIDQRSIRVNS